MAVQSLSQNPTPSLEADEAMVRGRQTMEKQKPLRSKPSSDLRSHNTSPSQKNALPRWKHKGQAKSSLDLACTWIVDHQIGIAVHILSLLFFTHICFPSARHHTQKFFNISYYNEQTHKFALGWDDIFFVFFWIIVFTGTRCATMDYVLTPLAGWAGIRKKKARVRFAEQAWIFIYPSASWSVGMYIFYNSKYWFNLTELWADFPSREMDGLTKWYYLVQFAFWLQQIAVINIEERRKDYAQMFFHHIITCALIFASYGYHQSKVGNVILCLMDSVDLFLPLAKMFKYLNFTTLCDATFGVFMVTWFIARHLCYMTVCWSIYAQVPKVMPYGCFRGSDTNLEGPLPIPDDWDHLIQPFYDPEGLICMNNNIRLCFLGLLLVLQAVLLVWLTMIVRVAYKVITGQGAEDVRSDDEDGDEDEEEEDEETRLLEKIPEPMQQPAFIEEEVGVEDMRFPAAGEAGRKGNRASPAARSRTPRKSDGGSGGGPAATTGVSLRPGDRKELLGRIGCDKGS